MGVEFPAMLNVFAWPGLAAGAAGKSLFDPAASSSPVNP
jgi:hypothetical protein